ncbi:allatotropins-like [Daktulosphaira vitifoliae]|uniref:allatotropins-like n=1 Tax=Daktulosphaira vitifoliae TaxID=58002 RepID=UPI0021A9B33F|nr:allatotropins-like [Daktulosphaira vitifoliae]
MVVKTVMVQLFVLTIIFLMLTIVTPYPTFENNVNEFKNKNRDKVRTIRGFKNMDLATARGFGKRTENLLLNLLPSETSGDFKEDNLKQNIPIDWVSRKLSNDQYLAKALVENFIDTNRDGQISVEELLQPINGEQ